MKLPDITNEEQYVQDWLTIEANSNEVASKYGWTGHNLSGRVRKARKVPNIVVNTKEEMLELIDLVEGPITLSHWLGLSPAKSSALVYELLAPDELLEELYVNQGMSNKQILAYLNLKVLTLSSITTKIKRLGLVHKEGDKERIRLAGINTYLQDAERVSLNHERRKATMKDRYGVSTISPFAVKEFSEKARKSIVENNGGTPEEAYKRIHQRTKQTSRERYGVENYKQSRESRIKSLHHVPTTYVRDAEEAFQLLATDEPGQAELLHNFLLAISEDLGKPSFTRKEVADLIGVSYLTVINQPNYHISADEPLIVNAPREEQREVVDFVKSFGIDVQEEIRPDWLEGKELDIYVPSRNFAIEFNGTQWHASAGEHTSKHLPNTYHQRKTTLSRENGVTLMHIWEYDWNRPEKRAIIESQIKYHLDMIVNRYYARKMDLKPVGAADERVFLNENHIQGYVPSSEKYGLYDGDDLVALMTFGKRRFDNEQGWELLRFATKLDTTVAGGASKLLKHFMAQHSGETLLSYANNDLAFDSNSSVYAKLGFQYKSTTVPGYKWVKGYRDKWTVVSRQRVQPWRLKEYTSEGSKKPFDGAERDYQESDTERSYMSRHGFLQVFDAGNDVYELNM